MKHWQTYIKGIKLYLPKGLKEDLDIFIDDMLHSEMDIVVVVDGKEGVGKSRTARLIGKYISHIANVPFDENNIHFTVRDYVKFSENSPKHTINILDESREALNKRRSMSKSNVFFTNFISEVRDHQQVHIIVLPAIHDLDNYIAVWRMSLLVNCLKTHVKNEESRSGYKLSRGYIRVYENGKELQTVLFNRTKYGYYSYPKQPKYFVKMKDQEPFTEEQIKKYKDKKAALRKEKYADMDKASESRREQSFVKIVMKLHSDGKTHKEIAEMCGMGRTTITEIINKEKSKSDDAT